MSPRPPPLHLIIRFAISIPDLRLPVEAPDTTNAATLCTLIRPHLPPQYATCALRLIYSGALLSLSIPLTTSLRLRRPTPSANRLDTTDYNSFEYGRASPSPLSASPGISPTRPASHSSQELYIHCAISPETHLSPSDLADESLTATSLSSLPARSDAAQPDEDASKYNNNNNNSQSESPNAEPQAQRQPPRTTTSPPPQGFDRLLSAGLSPAEVAALRAQFLAIHAHAHTPDTMPSASELRAREERWLDSGAAPRGGGGLGQGVTAAAGAGNGTGPGDDDVADDDDDFMGGGGGRGLEDMLWGNLMGFFWAIGAIVWLVREEGVWSRRRQVGVVTGVLVNLAFCFLRPG